MTEGQGHGDGYHHGDLRRALVDAAIERIGEGGPHSVSLRALSRRLGVSTGAPYRHFENKQALLAQVAVEGFAGLETALREAYEASPPETRLKELGVAYVRYALAHPAHFHVMFDAELTDAGAYPQVRDAEEEAYRHLRRAVADLQESGEIPPAPVDMVALGPHALVHGFAMLALSGQLARRELPVEDPGALIRELMWMEGSG